MRIKSLAWIVLFLLPTPLVSASDIEDTLTALPQMAPEQCALQSPGELLDKLLAEDPRPHGVGSCEACIDRFYEAYATQLAKKTDADYPTAKKIRPLILSAFEGCFDYLLRAHEWTDGHDENRLPADVEWILFRGAQQEYRGRADFGGEDDFLNNARVDEDSTYTPKLMMQIALTIGEANANHGARFDRDILPIFQRSLHQLAQAEKTMKDDEEKFYFRRHMVLLLTRIP